MNKKVFIHGGIIKTGSSFLQKNIFSELNGCFDYINSTGCSTSRDVAQSKKMSLLISNENLLGHPLLCSKYNRTFLDQFKKGLIWGESVYNKPFWIIGFREQSSFVKSLYKQYLHEWGTVDWEKFLEEHREVFERGLFFSEYIEFAKNTVQEDRLFMYDFDEFRTSPNLIVEDLLKYLHFYNPERKCNPLQLKLNEKVNKGVPDRLVGILRSLNQMSDTLHKYMGFRLAFRLGSIKLNPTILCRKYLSRLEYFKKDSYENILDVSGLKAYYNSDWLRCKELLGSRDYENINS